MDYSEVELYSGKGATHNPDVTWYFSWYMKNPDTDEMERIRRTFSINRYGDIDQRLKVARAIIKHLNRALRDRKVDFFKVSNSTPKQDAAAETEGATLIINHLTSALTKHKQRNLRKYRKGEKKKEPNKRTIETYELYIRRLGWYLQDNRLEKLRLNQFTSDYADGFLDYMIEVKELSNKTINETIGVIRMLFEQLRKDKLIKVNPFLDVSSLPVDKSSKYELFTNDEKIAIAERLLEHPFLNLTSKLIHGCFIRPQEVCCLLRSDFDFTVTEDKPPTVTVRFAIGKTIRTSTREIPEHVLKYLLEMKVDQLAPNQLIMEPLCGNHPEPDLRRKKITEAWKKYIINERSKGGLGINKKMYSLKHQGNVDYIINNAHYDILWLQQQNGHATLDMTEKYIKDLPIRKLKTSNAVIIPFGEFRT